jgi:hypothetical protein
MPSPKRRRLDIRRKRKQRAKKQRLAGMKHVTHYVTGQTRKEPFNGLKAILREGFRSSSFPNAILNEVKPFPRERLFFPKSKAAATQGDSYALVLRSRDLDWRFTKTDDLGTRQVSLKHARPGQVRKVLVKINPKLSAEERSKRKAFYKAELEALKKELGLRFSLEFH